MNIEPIAFFRSPLTSKFGIPRQSGLAPALAALFTTDEQQALRQVLAQNPRPRYHDDPQRLYGMPFAGRDVRFRVADGLVTVVAAV